MKRFCYVALLVAVVTLGFYSFAYAKGLLAASPSACGCSDCACPDSDGVSCSCDVCGCEG